MLRSMLCWNPQAGYPQEKQPGSSNEERVPAWLLHHLRRWDIGSRQKTMKNELEKPSREFRGAQLREFQADVVSSHPVCIQLGLDRFGDLVILGRR